MTAPDAVLPTLRGSGHWPGLARWALLGLLLFLMLAALSLSPTGATAARVPPAALLGGFSFVLSFVGIVLGVVTIRANTRLARAFKRGVQAHLAGTTLFAGLRASTGASHLVLWTCLVAITGASATAMFVRDSRQQRALLAESAAAARAAPVASRIGATLTAVAEIRGVLPVRVYEFRIPEHRLDNIFAAFSTAAPGQLLRGQQFLDARGDPHLSRSAYAKAACYLTEVGGQVPREPVSLAYIRVFGGRSCYLFVPAAALGPLVLSAQDQQVWEEMQRGG